MQDSCSYLSVEIAQNDQPYLPPVHTGEFKKHPKMAISLIRMVQNVYPAFMRCSRQYRNLKNLLRAGFAHDSEHARRSGDLALFCVICPQIGKNVSVEEMEASNNP
jgi:hypothetical protein